MPSVWSVMRMAIPFISVVGLLSVRLAGASQDSGSVIPAESTYLLRAPVPSRCTPSCSALPPLNPQQPTVSSRGTLHCLISEGVMMNL